MRKHRRSRLKKVGLPPGTPVHVGEVRTRQTGISVFRYDAAQLAEQAATGSLAGLDLATPPGSVLWINVHGLHDSTLISEIGQRFGLHPLTVEDILHTDQRPKLDSFDDYLYCVTRFFSYDSAAQDIGSEQVSLILGRNFVLTFQERPTGTFEPVRERLRADKGQIRRAAADYLAYALLDMTVDRYFIVLEQIGDDCEAAEDALLHKPSPAALQSIHKLKRETLELRRAVWPLREVLNALARNEGGFFQPGTVLYLRDVYDHTVHFIESLESLRDLLAGMLDIYLSTLSNRVNMEVRALTVVAMLFMPATLIAGIFGMNFKEMPLLQNPDGFWIAMASMGGIALLMGLIFWRRQWLSRRV